MGNVPAVEPCLPKPCIHEDCAVRQACGAPDCDLGNVEDCFETSVVPAGAVFENTLELLTEMDQKMLQFCGGTNLVGVRWLFRLGAGVDAVDLNGTTALHVACRTGSLAIVKELVAVRRMPSDICDVAGWTPLHVAIAMSRRPVALYLVKMRAPLFVKSNEGKTPLAMCNAHMRQAIDFFLEQEAAGKQSIPTGEEEHTEAIEAQFEPYFVPRSPCIKRTPHHETFVRLGQNMFNKQPGQGLAFLVASGCVRDYPQDISLFLRRASKLDKDILCRFLGESLAMSQSLRMEFLNTVPFRHTGVLTSLEKVFALLTLPRDLEKIDRLVQSIAIIWWIQHKRIAAGQGTNDDESIADDPGSEKHEFKGVELKQYLSSYHTLYQLMFSSIMLHRDHYENCGPGLAKDRIRMGISEWLEINRGLEGDRPGQELFPGILRNTFLRVGDARRPQLSMAQVPSNPGGGGDPRGTGLIDKEDFAMISGRNEPPKSGRLQHTSMRAMTEKPVRSPRSVSYIRHERGYTSNPLDWLQSGGSQQRAWISLCRTLLFISTKPSYEDAPYAFVDMQQVSVQRDGHGVVLLGTPVARPSNRESLESQLIDQVVAKGSQAAFSAYAQAALALATASHIRASRKNLALQQYMETKQFPVIFLLPDGRWQDLPMFRLQLEFVPHQPHAIDEHQLAERWTRCLQSASRQIEEPDQLMIDDSCENVEVFTM